jgi:hypothetical protein
MLPAPRELVIGTTPAAYFGAPTAADITRILAAVG